MTKIAVKTPLVEMGGDEMAAIMWELIKKRLILPYLDINLKTYDLAIKNRDKTDDRITAQAAEAIKKYGVGVKCATITADEARVEEFALKRMYPSPNGSIRKILNGTVFREPIIIKNIPPKVTGWKKPIVIARHGFGDQYQASEIMLEEGDEVELLLRRPNGEGEVFPVVKAPKSGGAAMVIYNFRDSVTSFARSCFRYAFGRRMSVYFSTKNTILRSYDGMFKDAFNHIYRTEFRETFKKAGLSYSHRLIDDMAAVAIRMEGGYLWACKNYDGDVFSDVVAQGFGSLGLMTSVLVTADGKTVETEAAHGTVTAHFRRHQRGEVTSTNPVASIFAWSRGLRFRAKFDDSPTLAEFAEKLENSTIRTVEEGEMTKDLALLVGPSQKWLTLEQFIEAVTRRLERG